MAPKTLNDLDPGVYPKASDGEVITLTRQEFANLVAQAITAKNSSNSHGFRPRNNKSTNKSKTFVYKLNLPVEKVAEPNGNSYYAVVLGEEAGKRSVLPLSSNRFGCPWTVKENANNPGSYYIDGFGIAELADFGNRNRLLKPSRPPFKVKAPDLRIKLYPKDTNPKEMRGVISWGIMADGQLQILEWVKP